MSSFGVLSTGFNKKLLSDILDEIETDQKTDISSDLNTTATSVLGQLNGIFADKLREGWDVLEGVYNGLYPDTATGAQLDGVAAITGATRLPATKSTVLLTATGDATTVLPVGRQASVTNGGTFETTEAGPAFVADPVWAGTTAYSTGDYVSNNGDGGLDRIYICLIGGTSAASPGPQNEDSVIVDGTAVWGFVGRGLARAEVNAESVDFGPIVGQSNTIKNIETPVTGWLGVNNVLDAALGTNIETDAAFRVRREELIRLAGAATLEAIRSAVIATTGVTQAYIFENTTLITDSNGVPGKAFEAVVEGGADADVAQTLFDTKPCGIQAWGQDVTELVVDSQGFSHTIEFSRPTVREMFIDVTVTTDGNYPASGDADVAQALKDLGDLLNIGQDVIYQKFRCAPFDVAGVTDVTVMEIDPRPFSLTSGNAETYNFSGTLGAGPWPLTVKVDLGAPQTINFVSADFLDDTAATAAEVAAAFSVAAAGATGSDASGSVVISSDASHAIEVTGGSANTVLGFATAFDPTGTVNVTIATRDLATFDTSRINVTSV